MHLKYYDTVRSWMGYINHLQQMWRSGYTVSFLFPRSVDRHSCKIGLCLRKVRVRLQCCRSKQGHKRLRKCGSFVWQFPQQILVIHVRKYSGQFVLVEKINKDNAFKRMHTPIFSTAIWSWCNPSCNCACNRKQAQLQDGLHQLQIAVENIGVCILLNT